jgi:hypothetical protein
MICFASQSPAQYLFTCDSLPPSEVPYQTKILPKERHIQLKITTDTINLDLREGGLTVTKYYLAGRRLSRECLVSSSDVTRKLLYPPSLSFSLSLLSVTNPFKRETRESKTGQRRSEPRSLVSLSVYGSITVYSKNYTEPINTKRSYLLKKIWYI